MLATTISNQHTILIVDDSQRQDRQTIINILQSNGYRVLAVSTVEQALEMTRAHLPDLILVDESTLQSEDNNLKHRLKEQFQTKRIPLILMAQAADGMWRSKMTSLGAADYVTKPIAAKEDLLTRIKTHLTIKELTSSLNLQTKYQQQLLDISDRIHQSLDMESIFTTTTQEIRRFLACDRLSLVSIVNEELQIVSQTVSNKVNGRELPKIQLKFFFGSDQEYQAYQDQKNKIKLINYDQVFNPSPNADILVTNNGSNNDHIVNNLINDGRIEICSQLIAPIILEQIPAKTNTYFPLWGWLIADQCSPRQWQRHELMSLQQLIAQLSIAMEHGLIYQKLEQSHKQTQKINQYLKELSLCDSLTKVFNRRYFEKQIKQEWHRLKRISAPLAVIMCDVDYFKIYNDTYGHLAGDECLQQIARTIANTIKRPADIVARYGGEEFIIILPHTPQSGAIRVAQLIKNAVRELAIPHPNSAVDSIVTISSGIASTVPVANESPHLLVNAADQALFQAKKLGRDCLAVYQQPISESNELQKYEMKWGRRIRYALQADLFNLYLQPITALNQDSSHQRFEVLLRLQEQENKVIAPGVFLEVAERNSLMPSIDTWVISRLFELLTSQKELTYWHNFQFSVNLSGASLNNEPFIEFLLHKLTSSNLPPQLFCFEITEAIAINHLDKIQQLIFTLKELGCSFALDDFGKGMSSLTYLKNLPVDYLKIDGSFITELNKDDASKVMVEAIKHLAAGIGLKTVAEFVENQEILDTLRDMNIDYGQGYHLGRPQKFIDVLSSPELAHQV